MTMSSTLKQEYEEKIEILQTQHERKSKELDNKIKMLENEQLVLTQVYFMFNTIFPFISLFVVSNESRRSIRWELKFINKNKKH